MNRFTTTSLIALLLIVLNTKPSISDVISFSVSSSVNKNTVPSSHTAGSFKVTPAQEAAVIAYEQKLNKLHHTGSEDLIVGDYSGAAQAYKELIPMDSSDIDSKENLAYALLGMGQNVQALQVLHNAFYYKGNTLYTSGRDIRAYATYALLENEAGNWKEAVLAYDLAGVPGALTFNGIWPSLNLKFSTNTPDPTLLAAAAHTLIGNVLSSPPIHINGRDGYDHAYDPAIAQLERAVSLAPKWPTAWFYLGRALQSAHRYQQALTAFNQGIKVAGTDKKVVDQIQSGMRWNLSNLADAQRKTAQAGVSASIPAH